MNELYINTDFGNMYVRFNQEKQVKHNKVLFFLHGWGTSSETFEEVYKEFLDYKIITIDFLGFGKSKNIIKPMSLFDYVNCVMNVISYLGYKESDVVLIGHSFGGRVAIRLAALKKFNQLILISPKVYKSKGIKFKLKIFKYKLKKLFLYLFSKNKYHKFISSSGSIDYKQANPIMKDTMKRIVNYDLRKDLIKININVSLFIGVNDNIVSYKEMLSVYQKIKNCHFIPFYKSGHFCFQTERRKFVMTLKKELENV